MSHCETPSQASLLLGDLSAHNLQKGPARRVKDRPIRVRRGPDLLHLFVGLQDDLGVLA